ncbi:MAG: glutathione-dependent formaldehyde dehydrogenase, partial [Candidatus Korobacteraceae bacterium]
THMMRFMKPLLERIERGDIDPSFVTSHRMPLEEAPRMYQIFRDKQDRCTKVVLDPWANGTRAAA